MYSCLLWLNLHIEQIEDGALGLPKGPSKAYLYWVTREQSSFVWFRDFIRDVSKKTDQVKWAVEVHNFLTSMYKEEDARSALLSAIQMLYHSKRAIDIISRTPVSKLLGEASIILTIDRWQVQCVLLVKMWLCRFGLISHDRIGSASSWSCQEGIEEQGSVSRGWKSNEYESRCFSYLSDNGKLLMILLH